MCACRCDAETLDIRVLVVGIENLRHRKPSARCPRLSHVRIGTFKNRSCLQLRLEFDGFRDIFGHQSFHMTGTPVASFA